MTRQNEIRRRQSHSMNLLYNLRRRIQFGAEQVESWTVGRATSNWHLEIGRDSESDSLNTGK